MLLVVGLARPEAQVPEPRREGTVILAFDTSASMAAPDQQPTRLAAAKELAKAFVEQQPPTVLIGVVAFSGTGLVTQEAGPDRGPVLAAIDRLTPTGGTGMAGGLQAALSAIVGEPVQIGVSRSGGIEQQGPDLGYHGSASIVLLSDGEDTGELDPLELVDVVSSAGVRVYPGGAGLPRRARSWRSTASRSPPPSTRSGCGRSRTAPTAATSPPPIPRRWPRCREAVDLAWTVQPRRVELTAVAAALAGLLVLASLVLSLRRTGRAV